MKGQRLLLRSVKIEEALVAEFTDKVMDIFKKNTVGPQKYLNTYKKYIDLMNNKADQEVSAFLKETHAIPGFRKKIESYQRLKDEIASLRITVPLSLFCLDCIALNQELCNRTQKLKNRLVVFEVDENRQLNRELCHQYDDISEKITEEPKTTEELVSLINFLRKSQDVTAFKLKGYVDDAARRLEFLLDYAQFSYEDIKLNSQVFHWPEQLQTIFDASSTKLQTGREKSEDEVKSKVKAFEEKLAGYEKEVEGFKKKEMMNTDEMKNNVELLDRLESDLTQARDELEQINMEEKLLEFEQTAFPQVQAMFQSKDPYDKLWRTAYSFTQKHEKWQHGPFQAMNAEDIDNDVNDMWRLMYKLNKTFSDIVGPRTVADKIRRKIEQFKAHLPLLHVICNPGIRDRHWERMSDIVQADIKPQEETSLMNMVEIGLSDPKVIEKLEEISGAASKEYSLEKAMEKMKLEWKDMVFEFIAYRDTGVSILSSVDDIQVLLDDHIIKAQTMRGSPFIKPFEQEMKEWEEKLVMMQDILDQWLKVQATWLYLEPIFSSEDIIAQMPEEGRKFATVDTYWKDIMAESVKDTHCLAATAQNNMLGRLTEANQLLEEILKGLNNYLEKKRLFFPRFFFLSNDELLEILSETKDPTRVQPHLKKCFEGIARLEFTEEQEIVGMISSDGETVPYVHKIIPAKAKGMVEKWLVEVEEAMLYNVRKVTSDSVKDYSATPRRKWVLSWPGQVVICCSSIYWTSEVSEAMKTPNGMNEYLEKSNKQIDEIVELVRGKLETGRESDTGCSDCYRCPCS
ncbi:DNAH3 [Bugula neritina]|uniref:DNAH3 n=1 Tax=Bugula neritina TaxID=10212 RepID=A0A7J7JVT0_BUGNE|nr:DNAH3 [Bugula neritina]